MNVSGGNDLVHQTCENPQRKETWLPEYCYAWIYSKGNISNRISRRKQFDQFGHKLETPNDRFSVLNAGLSASEALLCCLCCGSVILGHLWHFREYEGFLITYLYQKILDYR